MKILVFHGFSQSSERLSKILSRTKLFRGHDLTIPNGTHPCSVPEVIWSDPDSREWFLIKAFGTPGTSYEERGRIFTESIQEETYFHCHGILDSLEDISNRYGMRTWDVVVGFSQGTAMATMLLSLRLIRAKKVILFSFCPTMDVDLRSLMKPIDIPVLSIVGIKDELIPPEISQERVRDFYTDVAEYEHGGGHVIPGRKKDRDRIYEFLAL